jgi:hypothetical protein
MSLDDRDKVTLFNVMAGSELNVVNYLFDLPAQEEYHRNKNRITQKDISVRDQILS